MKELVDQYAALAKEKGRIEKQMKALKKDLLQAWNARAPEDADRNKLVGFNNTVTVVVGTRNNFDRKKYELKFGAFHPAYFKSSETIQLRT